MHPILLNIDGLRMPTYGVAMVLTFIGVGLMLLHRYPRALLTDLDVRNCFLLVLAAVFGAQTLVSVVGRADQDAMAAFPTLVLALALLYGYARWRRIDWRRLLDLLTPYALVALTLQRTFGCFMAGCCHGRPTDSPLGVRFPLASVAGRAWPGLHVHPTQLYYAAGLLLVLAGLWLWHRQPQRRPGDIGALGLAGMAVGYLVVGVWRGDGWRFWSLSGVLAMAMLAWSLWFFLRGRRPPDPSDQAPPAR